MDLGKAGMLLSEGRRLFDSGLLTDALELLGRARASAPQDPICARWLAEAQITAGALDGASVTLGEALAATPGCAELIALQADVALKHGVLTSAAALVDAAIHSGRCGPFLLAKRGRIHLVAGEADLAAQCLRRGLELAPHDHKLQSLLILAASYDQAVTTETLKRLQKSWSAPRSAANSTFTLREGTDRPLRVGYISNAFNRHAAAKVFSAVLLHHDPAKIETYYYDTGRRHDEATIRFRLAAARWRSITGLDDLSAAQLIRRDQIDVLVDLAGHFPHNRLGIFALRAAPVQVSAWGYVAGPGIPQIDYLLTDARIVPAGEAALFPERVVNLPCAQPYNGDLIPRTAPPVPIDRHETGPIRFGSFNRYDKLSEATLTLWAEILTACPDATLTLKDRFFAEAPPRRRICAIVKRAGVDPSRIRFEPRQGHADYLAAFSRIDLALDPFPVSGGVTTLDGLSQGVPAITLYGAAPTGRISASILTFLGLDPCICHTPRDYVRTAVELSRDPAMLADLRATVRARFQRFAAAQRKNYAETVEAAYREVWERYCFQEG